MTKSFGESTILTKENIAAMLALIGKEEKALSSPTAIVMLSNLKQNLKVLFDKLCQRELDFCFLRMGGSVSMDDQYVEYARIDKLPKMTKTFALAQYLSTIQQYAGRNHIELVSEEESPEYFEFVVSVRDY
jgi:hypothetical protein